MKILFLTNNKISLPLIDWLKFHENEKVLVLSDKLNMAIVKKMNPDWLISYNYKYIISEEILSLFPKNAINLHISFLPWNRGAHPNLWSFLQKTKKGVTIHNLDKGIDTGEIIVQKEILFDEKRETLSSSYNKLHNEIQKIFKANWSKIKNHRIKSRKQKGKGSVHFLKDFSKLSSLLLIDNWDIPISKFLQKYYHLQKKDENGENRQKNN